MRSNIYSKPKWPTSSWHPLRVVSVHNWQNQLRKGLQILWVWLSYTRYLSVIGDDFTPHKNWLSLGGLVCFNCHGPRVPSHSIAIKRLRVGFACWAWCQSLMDMQGTCWLSWKESRTCRLQLYAFMGIVGPLRAASSMACTTAMTWRWVPELLGMHPG